MCVRVHVYVCVCVCVYVCVCVCVCVCSLTWTVEIRKLNCTKQVDSLHVHIIKCDSTVYYAYVGMTQEGCLT